MVVAHLLGEESGSFISWSEVIQFSFFPIGICVGMIIAWKCEVFGGIITIISIFAFHLIRSDLLLDIWIDGLATPGILFLLCGA